MDRGVLLNGDDDYGGIRRKGYRGIDHGGGLP